MGPEDRTYPACQRRLLELDCTIDPVGIGASEGLEPTLYRSIEECLGT
jgi:hypothetical protein